MNAEGMIKEVSMDFPIYRFLGKLKKDKGIWLPDEVIMCVCSSYFKNKAGIANKWAWFIVTVKKCWQEYNAQRNIQESKELNQLSQSKKVRNLLKGIG